MPPARIQTGRTNRAAQSTAPAASVARRTPRSARVASAQPESYRSPSGAQPPQLHSSARARPSTRGPPSSPNVFERLTGRAGTADGYSPTKPATAALTDRRLEGSPVRDRDGRAWTNLPTGGFVDLQSTLDGTFSGDATSLAMPPHRRQQLRQSNPNVTGTLFLPGQRPPSAGTYEGSANDQDTSRSGEGRLFEQQQRRPQTTPHLSSSARSSRDATDTGAGQPEYDGVPGTSNPRRRGRVPAAKEVWTETHYSVPRISQKMPLRSMHFDKQVNTLGRSNTRSEMINRLRTINMPHISYDIDGDGVVSPDDMAIAKLIDERGVGMLTETQRDKGRQKMAENFLHRNFNHERTGLTAEHDPAVVKRVSQCLPRVSKMDIRFKLGSSNNAALVLKPQTFGTLLDPPTFQRSLRPGDGPVGLPTSHAGSRAKMFAMRHQELVEKFNAAPRKSYMDGYDVRRARVLFREETHGQRCL